MSKDFKSHQEEVDKLGGKAMVHSGPPVQAEVIAMGEDMVRAAADPAVEGDVVAHPTKVAPGRQAMAEAAREIIGKNSIPSAITLKQTKGTEE